MKNRVVGSPECSHDAAVDGEAPIAGRCRSFAWRRGAAGPAPRAPHRADDRGVVGVAVGVHPYDVTAKRPDVRNSGTGEPPTDAGQDSFASISTLGQTAPDDADLILTVSVAGWCRP
jgi:hypothetical protein